MQKSSENISKNFQINTKWTLKSERTQSASDRQIDIFSVHQFIFAYLWWRHQYPQSIPSHPILVGRLISVLESIQLLEYAITPRGKKKSGYSLQSFKANDDYDDFSRKVITNTNNKEEEDDDDNDDDDNNNDK